MRILRGGAIQRWRIIRRTSGKKQGRRPSGALTNLDAPFQPDLDRAVPQVRVLLGIRSALQVLPHRDFRSGTEPKDAEKFQQILAFEQENQAFERGELSERNAPPKKPAESARPNRDDPSELAASGGNNIVEITVGRKNQIRGDEFRELMERGMVTA